ncbi:MAG: hypothetical protein MJ007_01160 [Paludibacteraceae bacterium]|nr:hypothetical protein [Paludibacteraceae bacterium]
MKTKLFSVLALVLGLGMVALTGCKKESKSEEPSGEVKITLPATATVEVGKSITISAVITPAVDGATVTFKADNANVSVVGVMQTATITGITAGTSTITATYQGKEAKCVVTISGGVTPGPTPDYEVLKGSDYYVMFLDGTTLTSLGDKVIADFGTNDQNRWLYVWDGTFAGGTPTGKNPFGLQEGWMCMTQAIGTGWAGAGLCYAIAGESDEYKEAADADLVNLNKLKSLDYEKCDLVLAFKKDQAGVGYEVSIIGSNVNGTESGTGKVMIDDSNCPADGEWHIISFPLNSIAGLDFGDFVGYGPNLLTFVANPYKEGGDFNLGAAFIYKRAEK